MEPVPPTISSPPPAPRQGPSGRPTGGAGFRRTHVISNAGDTAQPVPPSAPPPPPPGAGNIPSLDSSTTSERDGSSASSSASSNGEQKVRTVPASVAGTSPGTETKRRKHHRRTQDDAEPKKNAAAVVAPPAPLTAGVVEGAFGGTGAEAREGSVAGGAVILPTTKVGNDAVSMYSMSQSILPTDPRDRLYYRPRRHLLQCYVKRKREGNILKSLLPLKSYTYQYCLEHTNDFVLAARQRPSKSTSRADDLTDGVQAQSYEVSKGFGNVLFSINPDSHAKDTHSFVGKLSRRGAGHEVVMFSEGSKESRKEIAAVLMERMQDGQRRFKVILPAIDEETGFMRPLEGGQLRFLRDGRGTTLGGTAAGETSSRLGIDAALQSSSDEEVEADTTFGSPTVSPPHFKPTGEGQMPSSGAASAGPGSPAVKTRAKWRTHSLLVREYLANPRSANIIVLQNKAAKWDSTLRGYQLDFHGRATKASEKNFQLVPAAQPDKVVMLFGKQGEDRYAVDFRYPLCGLQAAAVATTLMAARQL